MIATVYTVQEIPTAGQSKVINSIGTGLTNLKRMEVDFGNIKSVKIRNSVSLITSMINAKVNSNKH